MGLRDKILEIGSKSQVDLLGRQLDFMNGQIPEEPRFLKPVSKVPAASVIAPVIAARIADACSDFPKLRDRVEHPQSVANALLAGHVDMTYIEPTTRGHYALESYESVSGLVQKMDSTMEVQHANDLLERRLGALGLS